MTEQENRVSFEDMGKRRLRTRLPLVPYGIVGQESDNNALLFEGHPESESLTRMYAGRIATKSCVTHAGETVEFALVSKAHPYLLKTESEAMIQYFGKPPLNSFVDFEGEYRHLGHDYLGLVEKTTKAMLDMDRDEDKKYIIAINIAPYSRFTGHQNNVQSLAAPHAHILGFSKKEVQHMEYMNTYSDEEEERVFNGQHDILNTTYRDIVNQLFEHYSLKYLGKTAHESIKGIKQIEQKQSGKINLLSQGFTFTINNLSDISKPEFLEKLIVFENSLRAIYRDLANIFIDNPDEIDNKGKDPKKLLLSPVDKQHEKLDEFFQANGLDLTQDTKIKLRQAVSINHYLINGESVNEKIFLRGYAYSLIAHPTEWNRPQGSWDVTLPLWLYGGGGIEALGINKVRPKDLESKENKLLLTQYIKATEARKGFNRNLALKLHELDPEIQIV